MLYNYLDHYTRGKDRVELIRAIKKCKSSCFWGLAANHAVGFLEWKPYLAPQTNVTVHPPVMFKEGLEILKRSKIILNSTPYFRDGSHERVFYGLASGCVAFTGESRYLHEQFDDGQGILFYQSMNRGDVNTRIDELLAHEKTREEMAAEGQQIVMQKHTWDQRVEDLVNFFYEQKAVPE